MDQHRRQAGEKCAIEHPPYERSVQRARIHTYNHCMKTALNELASQYLGIATPNGIKGCHADGASI
jgi:hypothetical protein